MKRRAAIILWALAAAVWLVRILWPDDAAQRITAWREWFDEMPERLDERLHPGGPKAVKINCVNNMKQIGLALRIWSGDNNDKYPFNISTNQGGSLEWCARNATGFDSNAWRHFPPMSNELNTPRVLVCPKDKSRTAVMDWAALGPTNVSYWLRTGTNVDETHPRVVVAVCPACGNTLYADGSVKPGRW